MSFVNHQHIGAERQGVRCAEGGHINDMDRLIKQFLQVKTCRKFLLPLPVQNSRRHNHHAVGERIFRDVLTHDQPSFELIRINNNDALIKYFDSPVNYEGIEQTVEIKHLKKAELHAESLVYRYDYEVPCLGQEVSRIL